VPRDEPDEPPSEGDEGADDNAAEGDSEWPIDEDQWPHDAEATEIRQLDAPTDDLMVGDISRLAGDRLTMYDLIYRGNVCLPKVDGECIEVMYFTMSRATMDNAKLESPAINGLTHVSDMPDLELDGDIHFLTPRFVGHLLGFKWTFLPETPPPFTLPIMPFSDVDIQTATVITDRMMIGEAGPPADGHFYLE
jgi:hypothetical protein